MPKIELLNGETGKIQAFEPIDAKEVLAHEGSVYSVPDETREQIGIDVGPRSGDGKISIPQLQGGDAEMQTGLSIEKYSRAAVVKAQPGRVPTDTQGRPLNATDEVTVGKGPRGKYYTKRGRELVDGPFETEDEAKAALVKPAPVKEPEPAPQSDAGPTKTSTEVK